MKSGVGVHSFLRMASACSVGVQAAARARAFLAQARKL